MGVANWCIKVMCDYWVRDACTPKRVYNTILSCYCKGLTQYFFYIAPADDEDDVLLGERCLYTKESV